jgi:hypothetical protein
MTLLFLGLLGAIGYVCLKGVLLDCYDLYATVD